MNFTYFELGTLNLELYDMLPFKQLIANHKVQSSKFKVQCLKQLIRLAYHLMLMHHLLPGWGLQEIEAAILAATALTAHRRNDIFHRIDENRIAWKLLYPTDEISL